MNKQKKSTPLFLVCVNDTEHSRTALQFAAARAKATDGEVGMLSVVDPLDYNTIFSVADVIKEERFAEARKLLDDLAKVLRAEDGITPKKWVREGLIAEQVCAAIEEYNASFLVLGVAADGSSNKGGLLTALVEHIGKGYHVPLLVVPGNMTDKEIEALS